MRIQAAAVGCETFDRAFHDRMASRRDFNRGVLKQTGGDPVVMLCMVRERDQHVELRAGARTMR